MVVGFAASPFDFFGSIGQFFSKLFVDADTLAGVLDWSYELPTLFGSIHPVIALLLGLFGVFLVLKIVIHLL